MAAAHSSIRDVTAFTDHKLLEILLGADGHQPAKLIAKATRERDKRLDVPSSTSRHQKDVALEGDTWFLRVLACEVAWLLDQNAFGDAMGCAQAPRLQPRGWDPLLQLASAIIEETAFEEAWAERLAA